MAFQTHEIFELGIPGPQRDRLVEAVVAGVKTATSSLLVEYENEGEPLPQVGERRILIGSEEEPLGVVELTAVNVVRLGDADLKLALDEGEGFQSVAEWRTAHEGFWIREVVPALNDPALLHLDDETLVVVERFRVVAVGPFSTDQRT